MSYHHCSDVYLCKCFGVAVLMFRKTEKTQFWPKSQETHFESRYSSPRHNISPRVLIYVLLYHTSPRVLIYYYFITHHHECWSIITLSHITTSVDLLLLYHTSPRVLIYYYFITHHHECWSIITLSHITMGLAIFTNTRSHINMDVDIFTNTGTWSHITTGVDIFTNTFFLSICLLCMPYAETFLILDRTSPRAWIYLLILDRTSPRACHNQIRTMT